MREILFRGKFGNELKYGFLSIEPRGLVIKEPYKNDSSNVWHIESDTIGQYTGFKDKDGNKIFEGDIVEFTNSDGDTTLYEVFWDGNNGKFAIATSGNRNYVDDFELFERNEYFKLFEVIGNIYDSPELLKE
ncbi:YopX family protein [uncultured Ruminococcus sp.]|uniref:YopX family protein n=1 Tax=uncultured Ruminococcus sp. TaxID=165186 RepID=UPI0026671A3F|nr:YopX family protein [uncultured Ruminococcus sp.]